MIHVARALAEIQMYYRSEDQDLVRILLNAKSSAEANLAVVALRDSMPEKAIVTAVNLREVFVALPECPCAMPVEVTQLARVAGLSKVKNAYTRLFQDDGGAYDLVVLGDGNLCYDICIATGGHSVFLKASPSPHDLLHGDALELIMRHDTLLDELISLAKSMELVFNPKLYMSLEDWALENAMGTMTDFGGLF